MCATASSVTTAYGGTDSMTTKEYRVFVVVTFVVHDNCWWRWFECDKSIDRQFKTRNWLTVWHKKTFSNQHVVRYVNNELGDNVHSPTRFFFSSDALSEVLEKNKILSKFVFWLLTAINRTACILFGQAFLDFGRHDSCYTNTHSHALYLWISACSFFGPFFFFSTVKIKTSKNYLFMFLSNEIAIKTFFYRWHISFSSTISWSSIIFQSVFFFRLKICRTFRLHFVSRCHSHTLTRSLHSFFTFFFHTSRCF